jgi:hypothetical protein
LIEMLRAGDDGHRLGEWLAIEWPIGGPAGLRWSPLIAHEVP